MQSLRSQGKLDNTAFGWCIGTWHDSAGLMTAAEVKAYDSARLPRPPACFVNVDVLLSMIERQPFRLHE